MKSFVCVLLAIFGIVHGRGFFLKKSLPSEKFDESTVEIGMVVIKDIIMSELGDLMKGVDEAFTKNRDKTREVVRGCVESDKPILCITEEVRKALSLSKTEGSITEKIVGLGEYFKAVHENCAESAPENICSEEIYEFGECAKNAGQRFCEGDFADNEEEAKDCKNGVKWVEGRGEEFYNKRCGSESEEASRRSLFRLFGKSEQ